jgi:hypothetical protein
MDDIEHPVKFERKERVPEVCREYAAELADDFLSRREGTNPTAGPATEIKKDVKAFLVLNDMRAYFSMFADWALNHQVGLALERMGFVPPNPSGTQERPEYLEKRAAVDVHKHEIAGAEFDFSAYTSGDVPRNPAFERQLLINILGSISTSNPVVNLVFHRAVDALHALDFGEMDPLFQAQSSTGLTQPAYSRMRAQLQALAHVEYLFQRQDRRGKGNIMEEVTDAFGVSLSAMKDWEKDLRGKLGHLQVSRELSFAKNAALKAMSALDKKDGAEAMNDYRYHDDKYGKEAMIRSGNAYKKSESARK